MAITATETVEGHQRAAGPYCTPAPGANRALACAAPIPGRPLDAGLALAGLDHIPPPLCRRRPQFSAAPAHPIFTQDDHPIAACFRQARLRRPIGLPPGTRQAQRAACPRPLLLALDPAHRLR
ncbi:MAG: hypothetical protein PHW25_15070 [Zoogloea sp.]|uniref:hypothetical protein n=1 Tax=Zoogloea sp. TaxID=49181 RepID=UPI00261A9BAC|nr:hypothetical protein [Zoogloea sp.]MDD3328402.1 hypothetical protein [Zoogloea sp.]